MAKPYSPEISSFIETVLKEDDWNYLFNEKWGMFQFNLSLEKINRISYYVSVSLDGFTTRAEAPVNVPLAQAETVCRIKEYIHMVNRNLRQGHLEMHPGTGEILYRCFTDCDGIEMSRDLVRNSICAAASAFELYGDGFMKILFARAGAVEAFMACEEEIGRETGEEIAEKCTSSGKEDVLELLAELVEHFTPKISVKEIPGSGKGLENNTDASQD